MSTAYIVYGKKYAVLQPNWIDGVHLVLGLGWVKSPSRFVCCRQIQIGDLKKLGHPVDKMWMVNAPKCFSFKMVNTSRDHPSITSSLLETFWPPHPTFFTAVGSAIASTSSSFSNNVIFDRSYLKILVTMKYIDF